MEATTARVIAVSVPPVLSVSMIPVFRLLARRFGKTAGWHAGLAVYWLVWGVAYPLGLLGWDAVVDLVRPPGLELVPALLAAFPLAFAAAGRLFPGSGYEKSTRWALPALLVSALGNGLFEEILWRGTYMALFPNSVVFRFLWPSLWFGLWHYAPGSVSSRGNVRVLMGGAAFLGLYLSFLAWHTDTIWWCVVAHTLAGIITVI